jgi:hypothetical protein
VASEVVFITLIPSKSARGGIDVSREWFLVKSSESERFMEKKTYQVPSLIAYGSIADHTFQTPGVGTKSSDTTFELDKFGEFSHPAAS